MSTVIATTMTDMRQVAEAEVIAGPSSILTMPYSINLGREARLTITGTPDDVVKAILTNQESTVGQALGLTQQLAAGLFESNADLVAKIQSSTEKTVEALTGSMTQLAKGLTPEVAAAEIAAESGEVTQRNLLIFAGVGLLFLILLIRR